MSSPVNDSGRDTSIVVVAWGPGGSSSATSSSLEQGVRFGRFGQLRFSNSNCSALRFGFYREVSVSSRIGLAGNRFVVRRQWDALCKEVCFR